MIQIWAEYVRGGALRGVLGLIYELGHDIALDFVVDCLKCKIILTVKNLKNKKKPFQPIYFWTLTLGFEPFNHFKLFHI